MNLHILGIGGTFMSGLALLAKQSAHRVTGSDMNLYPPMSTQLSEQGITVYEGYEPDHIPLDVDMVIVGNVIKRGNPAVEFVLAKQIPYQSGPEWLYQHILKDRWVLGVAGTHGKTTTSSLLAWILDQLGLAPGFLIGGIPENFGVSARLGESPYFVIEADEYDSAFFDKRSKFMHYHPKTIVLNNLEFDHADIFQNLEAIKQQFHFLVRTVPGNGLILHHAGDSNLIDVLKRGCWTPVQTFGKGGAWQAELLKNDGSCFNVLYEQKVLGEVNWDLLGLHNVDNALAALSAASHLGISLTDAINALNQFKNVKRRLEVKGQIKNIIVYDDFAHHPTAISKTLAGLRAKVGEKTRIIAVLEFGSYTMRSGAHKERIKDSLFNADMIICKIPVEDWGLSTILAEIESPSASFHDEEGIVAHLAKEVRSGDHVVIMSNSSFGGIHKKLLDAIEKVEA